MYNHKKCKLGLICHVYRGGNPHEIVDREYRYFALDLKPGETKFMKTYPQKVLALLVALITLVTSTSVAAAPSHGTVDIQILNVSDWHGQLDPLVVGTAQVGGAAALSAYFQADRAANPNTLTLTAGDAWAPPLRSQVSSMMSRPSRR